MSYVALFIYFVCIKWIILSSVYIYINVTNDTYRHFDGIVFDFVLIFGQTIYHWRTQKPNFTAKYDSSEISVFNLKCSAYIHNNKYIYIWVLYMQQMNFKCMCAINDGIKRIKMKILKIKINLNRMSPTNTTIEYK